MLHPHWAIYRHLHPEKGDSWEGGVKWKRECIENYPEAYVLPREAFNIDALNRASRILSSGKIEIPVELANFVVEDMAREYLWLWNTGKNGLRWSQIASEADAISVAIENLLGSLRTADSQTINKIYYILQDRLSSYADIITINLNTTCAELVFEEKEEDEDVMISRDFIRCLETLKDAAIAGNSRLREDDKGGRVNGFHDPVGKNAKTALTTTVFHTLKQLGLPSGCNPGGALSTFVALIHMAATGESPGSWCNKYAAEISKKERLWLNTRFKAVKRTM